jgi:Dolichyl-phosphate-mannose-protein mannosyltransferase
MTAAIDQPSLSSAGLSEPIARSPRLRSAAIAVSILAALLLWTWILRLPFQSIEGSDDAFFLAIAHLWTRGVLPYVGAFDIKPPGFFAILAGAETLFGDGLQTLKAVSIFSDAVAAAALYFLGCRMGSKSIGLFAALLYPFLSEIVANNPPYAPLAAFTTLSFLAALSRLPILMRSILAGLAIGAAVTIKQTAAFEAMALIVVLFRAPDAPSRRLNAGLAFLLAAALAPLGFLVYFAAHGAAGAMIADVVGAALLRPASGIENMSFVDGILRSLIYLIRPIEAIVALAGVGLIRRRAVAAGAPDAAIGALALWAVATILSVWMQHALFRAYLGPTFAPLLLLSGACVVFAAPELHRIVVPIRLGLVGLITVATAWLGHSAGFDLPQEARAIGAVAEAIRASGPASDDHLLVVNGAMALYGATELTPPTAYFHWEHTLCDFPGAGPSRLGGALATTPRYVAVARTVRFPCELPDAWRQVETALASSYRLLAHVEGDSNAYDVYEAVPPLRH